MRASYIKAFWSCPNPGKHLSARGTDPTSLLKLLQAAAISKILNSLLQPCSLDWSLTFANLRLNSSLVKEAFPLLHGHLGYKEVIEFHLEEVCFEHEIRLR